jgi:MFS family permease
MQQSQQERLAKPLTISLLWLTMALVFMIRYAMAAVAPVLIRDYGISPGEMGYVLSAWSWAYVAFYLAGGPLVDRYGPWAVLGIGSGLWGLATLGLPLADGVPWLFSARALFGLATIMTVPACTVAVARWFTDQERARAVAVVFSGTQVGLAVGAALTAYLLAEINWQAVFYCLGIASLLLTLAWARFYPDKRVGAALLRQIPGNPSAGSWSQLLRRRFTWGIALGQVGYLYGFYFFFTWLPGYLILERKMTILESGIIGSLPFLAGMLGTLGGGWLGDFLIQRGFSLTFSRKAIIGGGLTAATIFMVSVAFAQQTWLAVTMLILCMGCLRLATGSVNALPIDLAPPQRVGSLTSIQNFLGNFAGVLAPIVTGSILASTGSFVGALVVAGAMMTLGAISYLFILGSLGSDATRAQGSPMPHCKSDSESSQQ